MIAGLLREVGDRVTIMGDERPLAALGTDGGIMAAGPSGRQLSRGCVVVSDRGWFTKTATTDDVATYQTVCDTLFDRVRHLVPAARLPETPMRWESPTSLIGTHLPAPI